MMIKEQPEVNAAFLLPICSRLKKKKKVQSQKKNTSFLCLSKHKMPI